MPQEKLLWPDAEGASSEWARGNEVKWLERRGLLLP
jgi:hypothetical protein